MRNTYKILVGKPEGKKSLGRPKRRWRIILLNWKGVLFGEHYNSKGFLYAVSRALTAAGQPMD
jgi:hypothetical protein